MSESKHNTTNNDPLKARIIKTARSSFAREGIRSVKMDDLAAQLGISKRTLYETFANKEALVAACIREHRKERIEIWKEATVGTANVLEALLNFFKWTACAHQNINQRFFEDLKKYPEICAEMKRNRDEDFQGRMIFFSQGVEQGLFRSDIKFDLLDRQFHDLFDLFIESDYYRARGVNEVMQQALFVFLRGAATGKGVATIDAHLESQQETAQ